MLLTNDVHNNVARESNADIVDIYKVHDDESHRTTPFRLVLTLKDEKGRYADVEAMVDDGAMIAAIDTKIYESIRSELGGWRSSTKKLRMANGRIVKAEAEWSGQVEVGKAKVKADCVVFDSGGGWGFLFGKPLLEKFRATQRYEEGSLEV
ncbi:hypothetical protein C8R42DRAFT_597829, partial [Lentinula raphanica]